MLYTCNDRCASPTMWGRWPGKLQTVCLLRQNIPVCAMCLTLCQQDSTAHNLFTSLVVPWLSPVVPGCSQTVPSPSQRCDICTYNNFVGVTVNPTQPTTRTQLSSDHQRPAAFDEFQRSSSCAASSDILEGKPSVF